MVLSPRFSADRNKLLVAPLVVIHIILSLLLLLLVAGIEESLVLGIEVAPTIMASYLPPGWTEEKYGNHTEEDVAALPYEVGDLCRRALCPPPQPRVLADASTKELVQLNKRKKIEKRKATKEEPAFQKTVKDMGYDTWGYMIFRGDYSSDAMWEDFFTRFDALVESTIDKQIEHGYTVDEEVRKQLTWDTVEDSRLADVPIVAPDGTESIVGFVVLVCPAV